MISLKRLGAIAAVAAIVSVATLAGPRPKVSAASLSAGNLQRSSPTCVGSNDLCNIGIMCYWSGVPVGYTINDFWYNQSTNQTFTNQNVTIINSNGSNSSYEARRSFATAGVPWLYWCSARASDPSGYFQDSNTVSFTT